MSLTTGSLGRRCSCCGAASSALAAAQGSSAAPQPPATPTIAVAYSGGLDSSVLLHLAMKAFHPAPLPFPLLHIDTTYKFREMIEFRDRMAAEVGAMNVTEQVDAIRALGADPAKKLVLPRVAAAMLVMPILSIFSAMAV